MRKDVFPVMTCLKFSSYRKVAGDTCEGGQDHRYGPIQYACPIQGISNMFFQLLVSFGSCINTLTLGLVGPLYYIYILLLCPLSVLYVCVVLGNY